MRDQSSKTIASAKFSVGQIIKHKLFDYRGVIVDVDSCFQGEAQWYEVMALSRPPKDKPWYHVLVHGAQHSTYVAERNLEPDPDLEPIHHPDIDKHFSGLVKGTYMLKQSKN